MNVRSTIHGYCNRKVKNRMLKRLEAFADRIRHAEFYKQINDIVEVGLRRYHDKYVNSICTGTPFVLGEKYSRRDVCLLMNYGRDISSTMYGMKRMAMMYLFCYIS